MTYLAAVIGIHPHPAILVIQDLLAQARKDVALVCRAQKIPSAPHGILFVELLSSLLLICVETRLKFVAHAPRRPMLR